MFFTKFRRRYHLRNMRTMQKIVGSFCIICLLMGALGSVGIWTTSQMQAQITAIDAADVPKLTALTTARSEMQGVERDYMQATLEPDAQLWQIEMDQVTQDEVAMQQAFSHYLHFDHTSEDEIAEMAAYQRVFTLWDATLQSLRHLAAPDGTNSVAIIKLINEEWQPQSLALRQILTHGYRCAATCRYPGGAFTRSVSLPPLDHWPGYRDFVFRSHHARMDDCAPDLAPAGAVGPGGKSRCLGQPGRHR